MRIRGTKFFSCMRLTALLVTAAVPALAAETENYTVCTVNGTALTNFDFLDTYAYYMEMFSASGYDTEDDEVQKYVEEKAYTATIENQLLLQGMTEDGYYTFSDEEEAEFAKEGELEAVARKQAAMERLYSDLMADVTITDEDIQEFYEMTAEANEQGETEDKEQSETERSEETDAQAREWLWNMALEERMQAYLNELESTMVILTVADPDYSSYVSDAADE